MVDVQNLWRRRSIGFILMAPTLGVVSDAAAIEKVRFLRDDMAAMAWAVETRLQGDLDARVIDHAVPRSRVQVDRFFRYTRSSDGSVFLWLARKSGQSKAPGGQAFASISFAT
ncbi:hypothetical protein [Bradyrhizobium genosp. P]|uniref:hypothetical protein n=1 Tax=Bradyrhizobium genosp. P TaxID=83641 RepID=UPI003CFB9503